MYYPIFLLISLCVDFLTLLSSTTTTMNQTLATTTPPLSSSPISPSPLPLISSHSDSPSSSTTEQQLPPRSRTITHQLEEQSQDIGTMMFRQADGRLKINVYYETLCGDSKRFIRSQLYPLAIEQGGSKHLDIQFIPYGKAETSVSSTGDYSFTCQHQSSECDGNKMHSCALKYITDQDQQIEFITCSMRSAHPPTSLRKCAGDLRLNSSAENLIKTCSESREGDELLAANGVLTDALNPKLFFVPTTTYNGLFDEDKMWESLGSFRTVVCDHLSSSNSKVDICSRRSREYRGERRARRFAS